MCDDLTFINTTQKTFESYEKNVSMARMDEKKLHTWEFQLKRSSRNMRCKLFQKRFTGKTTECSKHLRHIAIDKYTLSELYKDFSEIFNSHSPKLEGGGGGGMHALKAQLKLP